MPAVSVTLPDALTACRSPAITASWKLLFRAAALLACDAPWELQALDGTAARVDQHALGMAPESQTLTLFSVIKSLLPSPAGGGGSWPLLLRPCELLAFKGRLPCACVYNLQPKLRVVQVIFPAFRRWNLTSPPAAVCWIRSGSVSRVLPSVPTILRRSPGCQLLKQPAGVVLHRQPLPLRLRRVGPESPEGPCDVLLIKTISRPAAFVNSYLPAA